MRGNSNTEHLPRLSLRNGIDDPFAAIFAANPAAHSRPIGHIPFHTGKARRPGFPCREGSYPPLVRLVWLLPGYSKENDFVPVRGPERRPVNKEVTIQTQ